MIWLARVLAGPVLWAVLFSAVYALHGTGCHLGWTQIELPAGDLHHLAMGSVWIAGLLLHAVLVRVLPAGRGTPRRIIVAGTWIGLVASLFTLFPLLVTSTCS